MAEKVPGDSSPDTDRDFDPSAEMLVHEYDDEHTLDEEEALSNSDAGSTELNALQKEGDMPIEDLLAMYGYGGNGPPGPAVDTNDSRGSSSEEEILSNQDLTLDKEEIARDLLKDDEDSNKETSVNDLMDSVAMEIPSQTHRLLRSANSQDSSDEDDEEDQDYQPTVDEDWKKTISVGSDYQAQIPATLQKYGDAPAYENEDRLLWDPSKLEDKEVESFLKDVQQSNLQSATGLSTIPQGSHIRDDEQALYLLLQCGQNIEEASRRRKMQAVPPTDPMSLWSEEECRNFENGLKTYGKDFFLIQQNKVRTRSVGELVQFYYLWKKTERHDAFTNKNRLEKKKYALHPGVTDYMDRFLDEQENPTPIHRERSSSPNFSSLLFGDHKRHPDLPRTPTQVDIPLIVEMVQKVVHPHELEKLSSELSTATASTSIPDPPVSMATSNAAPPTQGAVASVAPSNNTPSEAAIPAHPAATGDHLPMFTSAPPSLESTVVSTVACTLTATATVTTVPLPAMENSADHSVVTAEAPTVVSSGQVREAEDQIDSEPSAKRLKIDNTATRNDINCADVVENSHSIPGVEPDSPSSSVDSRPNEQNNGLPESVDNGSSCKDHIGQSMAVAIANVTATTVSMESKLRALPPSQSPTLTAE